MKLLTAKFLIALGILTLFLLDAFWHAPDRFGGEPVHLLPYTDTWAASFLCLLSLLYVVSHAGGWVLAKFRGKRDEEEENERAGKG